MKHMIQAAAILVLGFGLAGCTSDSPASPSAVTTETFRADLLTANEVPPIANDEAGGSASATIAFDLTKDSAGYVTSASMNVSLTATGFPNGTALTKAHIHPGGTGTNGGVFVNVGLTDGEVTFPSGAGSFTKNRIALTVDQANAILANPSGFYLNIHTARNPDGVARGQLTKAQ
jgi:CHRD domain